ncbi:MAG: alkaline phosphatase D family protein [Gemmatimonas sp.]
MDRRDFLADMSRAAALCAVIPNGWRVRHLPRFADDPFTLGVASGDPTPTGGVLWTRLAPRPLEAEGGMDGVRTVVSWQVADDERFANIVVQGRATAAPELSYSVHVNVDGLQSDRWYWYRFTSGTATSPAGRLRTSPAAGAITPLRLGFASCQHYEEGHFTALRHLSRENVDLVAFLGDYIYEYAGQGGRPRQHVGLEIRTLDDYRRRYAQYKADADLQAAHARAPWIVVWDDHEVDNNYAGTVGENGMESEESMRARRAVAYQAWWEHQPVRVPRAVSWADLNITRTIDWGGLAAFWMMDSRQYRSDQACGDGGRAVPCGEWADPSRTLLGAAQERWLSSGLGASRARWQVLANQVMLAPYDSTPGSVQTVSMDQWGGYPAARQRLLESISRHAPNRTVVLTGDIHSSWVNEVASDFSRPGRPVIAAEFVATSISSGGDGSATIPANAQAAIAENAHVKWHNRQRGYVTCNISENEWTADYHVVPYVSRPGAPVEVASRWGVQRGRAGVEKR